MSKSSSLPKSVQKILFSIDGRFFITIIKIKEDSNLVLAPFFKGIVI